LPVLNEASTVGGAVRSLRELITAGIVDEIVVMDSGSTDGSPTLARAAGALVWNAAEVLDEVGPLLGKGDVMWRALSCVSGDIVCFLDADTEVLPPHFAMGLVGPLLTDPTVTFTKATYRRPFKVNGVCIPDGGGRVNDILARPLLRAFASDLAGLRQPLAGEVAARRDLLTALPIVCGYGVEIAMLLDLVRLVGPSALVEVDLGERQNRHRPLSELGEMADAILAAFFARLGVGIPDGGARRRTQSVTVRPPHRTLRARNLSSGEIQAGGA
jgi:glucosyl-3-phosphoglycerate synthase